MKINKYESPIQPPKELSRLELVGGRVYRISTVPLESAALMLRTEDMRLYMLRSGREFFPLDVHKFVEVDAEVNVKGDVL